ncbi:MAG: hypothetical protein HC850_07540 [Rhodomicrobium sp.]|nr:hypothetical protein [Rhodomicrobium sp.]
MTRPDDETLMAYADGELDPVRMREIEVAIANDDKALATVDAFRRSKTMAEKAFDRPMHEPPPQFLIDAIMNAPASRAKDKTFAAPVVMKLRRAAPSGTSLLALAASIALLAGVGIGIFIAGPDRDSPAAGLLAVGPVPEESQLASTLSRLPAGKSAAIEGGNFNGQSVTLLATFRDASGRPCREFEIGSGSANAQTAAVACREAEGWSVRGVVQLTVGALPSANGGFEPAGADGTDPLAGVLSLIGASPVVSPAEEAALISQNWRDAERE